MTGASGNTLWLRLLLLLMTSYWGQGSQLYRCPSGLAYTVYTYGQKCYQLVNMKRYWGEAQSYCSYSGGMLVEIYDQSTMDFIGSRLNGSHWEENGVWFGAHDMHSEGSWQWNSGATWSYTNWGPNEPYGYWPAYHVNDCGVLRREHNWRWGTYPCNTPSYHYKFICMYNMSLPTTTTIQTITTTTRPTTTTVPSTSTATTPTDTPTTTLIPANKPMTSATTNPLVSTSSLSTTKSEQKFEATTTEKWTKPGDDSAEQSQLGEVKEGDMLGVYIGLAIGDVLLVLIIVAIVIAVCNKNDLLQDTVRRECEERFELTEALSALKEKLLQYKKPATGYGQSQRAASLSSGVSVARQDSPKDSPGQRSNSAGNSYSVPHPPPQPASLPSYMSSTSTTMGFDGDRAKTPGKVKGGNVADIRKRIAATMGRKCIFDGKFI